MKKFLIAISLVLGCAAPAAPTMAPAVMAGWTSAATTVEGILATDAIASVIAVGSVVYMSEASDDSSEVDGIEDDITYADLCKAHAALCSERRPPSIWTRWIRWAEQSKPGLGEFFPCWMCFQACLLEGASYGTHPWPSAVSYGDGLLPCDYELWEMR